MASTQSNIGTGYTQAITEDFGGIARQSVQDFEAKKERDYLNQERKYQKDLQLEDRYGIVDEDYILPDTEFRTLNDTTTELMSQYRDMHWDTFEKLKQNPNDDNLKKKLGKINGSVKQMGMAHKKMVALGDEFITLLKEDKLSGVDEDNYRERLEAYDEGRIKGKVDENANMQILFYDKKGKLQEVVPYNELIKGTPTKRVDVDVELDGLTQRIGSTQETYKEGNYIRERSVFGQQQQEMTRDWIDANLGTDEKSLEQNEPLADLLNQATGGSSKKRENFTEGDRVFVKNWLFNQVKGRYSTKESMKADPNAIAAANRAAAAAGKTGVLSMDLVNVGTTIDDAPSMSPEGNVQFSIGGKDGIAVDAAKTDRRVDTIEMTSDKKIIFKGQDKEKIKGIQDTRDKDEQDVVDEFNSKSDMDTAPLTIEDVFKTTDVNGNVTFYRSVPITIDAETVINKLANRFKVGNQTGLQKALYEKVAEKWGEQAATEMFSNKAKKLDAFGNEIK